MGKSYQYLMRKFSMINYILSFLTGWFVYYYVGYEKAIIFLLIMIAGSVVNMDIGKKK